MPNKLAVYMHDTPSKRLFGADYRFLSHGCVRVQGVYDYAEWLLQGTPGGPNGVWDKEALLDKMKTGARDDIKLSHAVPVIWVYLTGWSNRTASRISVTTSTGSTRERSDREGRTDFPGRSAGTAAGAAVCPPGPAARAAAHATSGPLRRSSRCRCSRRSRRTRAINERRAAAAKSRRSVRRTRRDPGARRADGQSRRPLSSPRRTLGRRRWASRQWIACVCAFKGRRRTVWGEGYTELFFLDEPTALAAGHRPCFECRRVEAQAFAAAFRDGASPRAAEMDAVLHRSGSRARASASSRPVLESLPDGAMIDRDGQPFAVRADALLPWSFAGYGAPRPRPRAGVARALTPPSILRALAAGYRPRWADALHAS